MLNLIITVVIAALVVGVLLWIVQSAPIIDPSVKPIAKWIILVLAAIWVIYLLVGALHGHGGVSLGRL